MAYVWVFVCTLLKMHHYHHFCSFIIAYIKRPKRVKHIHCEKEGTPRTNGCPVANACGVLPTPQPNLFSTFHDVITSNDHPFGCRIISADTNSQCYFVH